MVSFRGASSTVCCAAPPLDAFGFAKRRCAPNPRMNASARPAEGAKNQKPKQDQKPDQKPLTLALSRWERGLIEVFGRGTPTCDIALNSDLKSTPIVPLPLGRRLGGRRSDEGQIHRKSKAEYPCSSPLNRPSVSSPALDPDPRATSEG